MITKLRDTLSRNRLARWVAGSVLLLRASWYSLSGRRYAAISDCCSAVRASDGGFLQRIARRPIDGEIEATRRDGQNTLSEQYRVDPSCTNLALSYALVGNGPHDLFRDLIVLKAPASGEKGVILLKYARTFSAAIALLDVARLMEHYIFVLEPCWAGYCDPALLMFVAPGNPVIVQCFTDEDFRFVESVGAPLVPVRLGPADWVNSAIFAPPADIEKSFDLVMVANWAWHKRHVQLFRALSEIRDRPVRVLLAGFAWGGRTADDVRRDAASWVGDNVSIELVENLTQRELARHVAQCKAFVFLSRKEGDNKALVEAMFADVPAIVYRDTIGGARSRINSATGLLASDRELSAKILFMLDHWREFTAREWALRNTGSPVATRILDAAISRTVRERDGTYTRSIVEKVNSPNLAYRNPNDRRYFEADYEFITQCLRKAEFGLEDINDRALPRNVSDESL